MIDSIWQPIDPRTELAPSGSTSEQPRNAEMRSYLATPFLIGRHAYYLEKTVGRAPRPRLNDQYHMPLIGVQGFAYPHPVSVRSCLLSVCAKGRWSEFAGRRWHLQRPALL